MNSTKQNQKQKREPGPPIKRPRQATSVVQKRAASPSKSSGIRHRTADSDQPILSRRPANFKRPNLSNATRLDICKAKRILKRNAVAPITEDQVSSREDFLKIKEDIAWARDILPHFERAIDRRPEEDVEPIRETLIVEVKNSAPMRAHSQELPARSLDLLEADAYISPHLQIVESPPPRRNKSLKTPLESFVKLARGRTIIGVIDNSHPDGHIPRDQWGWIQASLASVALEVLRENPGAPPSCSDAGWFQGNTKLIACDNDRSAQLYKAAISKLGEVYPGAQLEVIEVQDIPSRPWATAWLPDTPSESNAILEILTTFNPNLPTRDWNVIKAIRFSGASMEVIFQISHESIIYLSRCDGQLSYGLNNIHMKFYETPHKALPNLEAFAAAVDPPSDYERKATDSPLSEDLSGDLSSGSDYEM